MTTLLFIFALLTVPTDRYICDLWTNAITRDGVLQACGITLLEGLRVEIRTVDELEFICAMDASYLNNIEELSIICEMDKPLDAYVLRLVQPGYNTIICYVQSVNEAAPSAEEIAVQCPRAVGGRYTVEFAGTKTPEPDHTFTCPARDLSAGFGLYDQTPNVTDLLTNDELTWLAGKLIWSGQITAPCDAAINPTTQIATPCGMAAARDVVTKWQNQFDSEIYASARSYNVPAKLLKRIMMRESQFWPYYTARAGEVGIMQVTDNGLDTLLRFDSAIDPDYFQRDDINKFWSRSVTRDALSCANCTLTDAISHTRKNMDMYARLLAAFHCRAVTINPALYGQYAWQQAVIDYNGSADYLRRIEQ